MQYQYSMTSIATIIVLCLGSRIETATGWVSPTTAIARSSPHSNSLVARRTAQTRCQMSLVPLSVDELEDLLVVGTPSGLQYATYWGRTKREQYNRFLESAIVTFLGVFFSYFMSFVVGGFLATVLGGIFAFWGILSPDLKSRQRNYELLAGRKLVDPWTVNEYDDEDTQGLYGSLFLGRVEDVCVVEDTAATEEFDLKDFDDYTMDTDELEQLAGTPYLLRIRLSDNDSREMQIHARMSEGYLDLEPGMPALTVLLSKSQSFSSLAALSDVFVPDGDCWVGDYPYLNRPEMEALLGEDDDLWQELKMQGRGSYMDNSNDINGDDDDDNAIKLESVKIIRRRGGSRP